MKTENLTIQEQIANCESRSDRKTLLRKWSKTAKIKQEKGDSRRVNEIVLDMYKNKEHQVFNNFWEWKKLGFKVKKGESAFFVWSKKRKGKEKTEGADQDKEFSFFSLAYLFSNAQVEPLKKKNDA